jgi:diaminopimelate epimerase
MKFSKFQALGNDFILVELDEGAGYRVSQSALARSICDRHLGVGADGLVLYQGTVSDAESDFSALIFNCDGSRAEMSGNGIRCLAAHLHESGRASGDVIRLRTVAGLRSLRLKHRDGNSFLYEAQMGMPVTEPARIPALVGNGTDPILEQPLDVGGEWVRVTLTSMGNPHCSTFWDDVESAPFDTLGPMLESHAAFPNRTNVEFIQVVDRHRLRVRFWERGVGPTMSSGTGSSAAAAAALLLGKVENPVTVETAIGMLEVSWVRGSQLQLTGAARIVCSGQYYPPEAVLRT